MTDIDHRQLGRDSLFLTADLRLFGSGGEHKVRVRNLSAGGMMAEGNVKVSRGTVIEVNLRNIGWVDGTVAWIQDNRFGIAFAEPIDPKLVRAPASTQPDAVVPRYARPLVSTVDTKRLCKI
ncbi:PilZ domain-containing protein [Novosphingobium sp. FKTRR1]|uniref:PilZ domain-containing protein n=1 Tax=Novosphingobium sp. FKTRR1 TaxID=2879118 RepID=UPI001CEFF0E0